MLMGLTGVKMSKSDPNSAIFMEDKEEDVNMKIQNAFCEDGNIKLNPLLEYVKYIVLPALGTLETELKVYDKYEDTEQDFEKNLLSSAILKNGVAKALNKILQPVRTHFETNEEAKQLLDQVKSFKVTK